MREVVPRVGCFLHTLGLGVRFTLGVSLASLRGPPFGPWQSRFGEGDCFVAKGAPRKDGRNSPRKRTTPYRECLEGSAAVFSEASLARVL